MASIINASSSGSGGIVQTADASGVLQLQTNGTVALSIDTSANITLADGSKNLTLQQTTAAGANSTSYPGYIAFTGDGWNTSLGSSPLGVRIGPGGNYTPDLGQVAPGLSISTQNTNGSMTQRMLLNGYGIGLGTGTYPISGTGIKFPATIDASNNANTLDDYEEGTWTPTDGSGASLSLSVGSANYTKIGRVVNAQFSVQYPSTANGLRAAIGNLPFTNLNVSLANFGGALGYTDVNASFGVHVDPGLTVCEFYKTDGSNLTNANLSGKSLRMLVTYFSND